jgi:hypothetical protein
MSRLEQAIAKVLDGSSLYWGFYSPESSGVYGTVEVRLNGSPDTVTAFIPPQGWVVDRVQWASAVFLRRQQLLDRSAIETMLVAMLELASAKGMRLHSWSPAADMG